MLSREEFEKTPEIILTAIKKTHFRTVYTYSSF
jgi:hypothetical protein